MKKTTLRGTRDYTKKAHTVEQQIELLKRRGMLITDESDARHYLSHINYYRLRAYWVPFETPTKAAGDHAFRQGTSFNDVCNLYMFDRKLRLLVLDAIERFDGFATRPVGPHPGSPCRPACPPQSPAIP